MPLLVSTPCATSDNGGYVNQAQHDRAGLTLTPINGRVVKRWRHIGQPAALSELAAGVDNQALDAVAQEMCYEALRTRSEK